MEGVTRIELANSCLEGRLASVSEALPEPVVGLEPTSFCVRSAAPIL